MPVINCNECGKEVSTTAKQCPHCGAREFKQTAFQSTGEYIAKQGVKVLPVPIVQLILILYSIIYIVGILHLPMAVSFLIIHFLPEDIIFGEMLNDWANWAYSAYIEFYSMIYEKIQEN